MWIDVIELRSFYESRMGQVARHLIRRQIRQTWPDTTGQRVLGIGYAVPYLRQFYDEAERVLAFMPAPQGVLRWPPEGRNCAALVEEASLPLANFSIDRVLLVHSLENSESFRTLLEEAWRVLIGDGRVLIVVPNRRGVWARSERTPFGQGQPWSLSQLSQLLRDCSFTPTRRSYALFTPPLPFGWLWKAAPAWERLGQRWFPRVGGVLILEAQKLLYAPTAPARRVAFRKPSLVPWPEIARPTNLRTKQSVLVAGEDEKPLLGEEVGEAR